MPARNALDRMSPFSADIGLRPPRQLLISIKARIGPMIKT
jgi:hypothetical protein